MRERFVSFSADLYLTHEKNRLLLLKATEKSTFFFSSTWTKVSVSVFLMDQCTDLATDATTTSNPLQSGCGNPTPTSKKSNSAISENAGARVRSKQYFDFSIKTEWDGTPYTKERPVQILIDGAGEFVRLQVEAPFYNDTAPPNGQSGQPYPKLYDYQVVEAFFLNHEDQYLEVELSPHGEHLVLLLNGRRNSVVQQLPLQYYVKKYENTWTGVAYIPLEYFPYHVTKFNAFAIHGEGSNRKYLSLFPTPEGKFKQPDFHRLEYFRKLDLNLLPPFYQKDMAPSDLWLLFPPRK